MGRTTVAVPSENPGGLDAYRAGHFGHCDVFTLVEVNDGKVDSVTTAPNPPHVQGGCMAPVNHLLDLGANALIVGGIGMRPLMGFRQVGIDVYFGPEGATVGSVIDRFLDGKLQVISDEQTCGGGGR